jgi:hypothetical protein
VSFTVFRNGKDKGKALGTRYSVKGIRQKGKEKSRKIIAKSNAGLCPRNSTGAGRDI